MRSNPKPSRTSTGRTALRLVLLSDTHEVDVPDGDIFIHAGDESSPKMPPAPEIWVMRSNPKQRRASTGRTALRLVLLSGTHEIEGLRMWGSPVTPMYGGAFGLSSAVDRKRLYARIPWDIDVLVSHGPPFGILDTAPISGLHEGCRELLDAVTRVKPKLHVFGHIHTAYGTYQTEHTIFINAARLGLHDAADKPPFVLQITRR